jgi:hypothetical protein
MCGGEQRPHLQRLLEHRKPQQAPMDRHREKTEQRVGQRVLPKQRTLVYVHQQAEQERDADPDAQRLVHVPEHQHQREQVRHRGLAAEWN